MIDLTSYSWLDPAFVLPDENEAHKEVLDAINKSSSTPLEKNILALYYIEEVYGAKKEKDHFHSNWGKELRSWKRSTAYQKIEKEIIGREEGKFTMSGIVIVMTGTLVFFFLKSVLSEEFLVNFSVDAIVGALALFFMGRNLMIKYRMLKRDATVKDYRWLDIASFVLCLFLKLALPAFFDLSLVVLIISYYIQKRWFTKAMHPKRA